MSPTSRRDEKLLTEGFALKGSSPKGHFLKEKTCLSKMKYVYSIREGTCSVGLGMESLDGEEVFKGKAFVQDPECDSRDFMGGKVGSHKVMEDPGAI